MLIVFSAPSGTGKSTIIAWLMREHPELALRFSVSATSRPPRGTERDGVEYHFLSPDAFRQKIADGEFIEYEEVYTDRYYGTLRSEVDERLARGENVVFDIDVHGAMNLKAAYGDRALLVFIQPPSLEALRQRLTARATDAPDVIEQRLARAQYELTFAPRFDAVVVNDNLNQACHDALQTIQKRLP